MIKINKCAIYGGTFDPIHNGHLHLIKELTNTGEFDKFIIVPTGTPSQRSAIASAEDRFEMTRLAVAQAIGSDSRVEVADIEVKRDGLSFAIDTVTEISQKYPQHEIYWVIGSDAFPSIETWHNFSELSKIVKFLVIERPGYTESVPPLEVQFERRKIAALDLSASEIRNQLRADQDISNNVPSSVLEFIKRNGLYGAA
ncbi:MAG: nicotinate-nucleotide adenylyltransferase [Actinomycetales bacterium]